MTEFRERATAVQARPRSMAAAVVIVLIWIAATALVGRWLWLSLAD